MNSTIVATYLVRVTLREDIERSEEHRLARLGGAPADRRGRPPTNDELVEIITDALKAALWDLTSHVTSERTDQ